MIGQVICAAAVNSHERELSRLLQLVDRPKIRTASMHRVRTVRQRYVYCSLYARRACLSAEIYSGQKT